MYCSAKKATVVTVTLSNYESTSMKIAAEVLRSIRNLIVGTTHGQADYEDFFHDAYGIIEFLTDLSDNPERAEKGLAEYINLFKDKGD